MLVSSRLLIAGLLLIGVYKITHWNNSIFVMFRTKHNAFRQILFSLLGMLAVQYTYMMSISIGNSAVATLLQYLAPLFIMGYYLITKHSQLTRQDGIAVTLTLVGTFFITYKRLLFNPLCSRFGSILGHFIWSLCSFLYAICCSAVTAISFIASGRVVDGYWWYCDESISSTVAN